MSAYVRGMRDWSSDGCSSDRGRRSSLFQMSEQGERYASRLQHLHCLDSKVSQNMGVRERCQSNGWRPRGSTDRVCSRVEGTRRFTALHPSECLRPRIGSAERRSEEHTSELQSLMRISYAVFCLKKKTK